MQNTQKKGRIARRRVPQRGFTLLLSALVATIVLALGSSIFSIAQKQVTLSSIGRDSQFAFYAADNGAECALYYDIRAAADTGFIGFATSSESSAMNSLTCDGVTVTPSRTDATSVGAVSEFTFDLFTVGTSSQPLSGYCVEVRVEKAPTAPFTSIHADGYSTSCATITTSGRALQRSVELNY